MSTFFGHVCHHSLVSDSESSNYFPMHFIGLSTSDEISSSLPFILKRLLICLVPTTKNFDYFALNFMHANVTIPSGKEKTHLVCTSLVVVTARSSMKPFIGSWYVFDFFFGPLVFLSIAVAIKLIPITNICGFVQLVAIPFSSCCPPAVNFPNVYPISIP